MAPKAGALAFQQRMLRRHQSLVNLGIILRDMSIELNRITIERNEAIKERKAERCVECGRKIKRP